MAWATVARRRHDPVRRQIPDHPADAAVRQRFDGGPAGAAADRVITLELAGCVEIRRDIGQYPVVMGVVAGQVLDHGKEFLAGLQGFPHQAERAARHIRVADQAVRLSQELRLAVAADAHEVAVGVGNLAAGIGLADDHVFVGHDVFTRGADGAAGLHGAFLVAGRA